MATLLRVALDARCLNTGHLRGMGKYLAEMLAHADALDSVAWTFFGDRPEAPFHLPALRDSRAVPFDLKGYRFHTWEQLGLPWRARRAAAGGVLHSAATTLPWWQPLPTVVTVHDTLPWQRTIADPYERWYWTRLVPAALARCAAVVTISEASRRDILGLWPELEPRLTVARHGIGDAYLDPAPLPRPASVRGEIGEHRYLLYVGGAAEHKRFEWAARVFERLGDRELRLLAVGFTGAEADAARGRLPASIAARVRFAPFVPEDDMPQVYRHAVATLYPTRYEGFGFPAVESQAVGTPVLFSPVGSLAELDGPRAEILPRDEMNAWVERLERIAAARSEPSEPDDAVRAWSRGFSWDRSARAHLAVYRAAAGLPASAAGG